VLLGGFIGLFGLVSLFVKERLYLTESLVATLVGVAFGPVGLGVVAPQRWFPDHSYLLREAARIVIGLQVMAAGVSVPGEFLRSNKLAIGMMLGPVMAVMWLISALCIQVALRLGWRESFIIGACVTPTDPVLAHSVIKGKFAERYIPTRLRHLLAVESGANDGLGFPFMMLPIWLMLQSSPGDALAHWLVHTWLWEILVSIIVGFICGFGARTLLKASMARKLIDKESFLVFTIALTLFVSGLVALMASDDLFAIFIAGNVFAWDDTFTSATQDSHISEVMDMLFNMTFFVFFGALIPWAEFARFGILKLSLTVGLILLFRRLPIVMIMRHTIPTLQSKKEAFFAGWFGPIGVGAIFFAIQARDIFQAHPTVVVDPAFLEAIFPVVTFIVLGSILIHGITVPLTNSHLKRRMKRKVKRRNKLAQQLASMSMLGETPVETPILDTHEDHEEHEEHEDEYVYVTDDEGEGEDELTESPLSDVVIDDSALREAPESPGSSIQPPRRRKKQHDRLEEHMESNGEK
jgi:NhaP-type Na+/H+ or K+/H+ antiporter